MTLQLGQPDLLRQTAYLNGEWCEADSGARTEIFNPATGELIGAVPKSCAPNNLPDGIRT